MASEPERDPADDDTVVVNPGAGAAPEETTQADEDWPVTDLYYVQPDGAATPEPPDTADEVITTAASAAGPAPRRFPPDVGPGVLLAALAVLAAVIVGAILLGRDDNEPQATTQPPSETQPQPPAETTPPPTKADVAVKDVEGMTVGEARAALEKQGLRVEVSRSPSERPRGEVLSQSPAAGSDVAKGTLIALVASSGTQPAPEQAQVEVPDFVGRSETNAAAAARELGLEVRIRRITSSERPGMVVDQRPAAGAVVDEGATVQLEVAKARPAVTRVEVPDVIGSTASAARSELRAAGLTVSTTSAVSQEPAGTVIQQSPRPGTQLEKGGTVRLTVSAGPANVDVPDVTGLDEASARTELERAGFAVRVTDESVTDPAQDGVVLRQTPSGGSSAEDGAVVTLVVGRLE